MSCPKNPRKAARLSKHFIKRLSSWIVLSTTLTLGAAKVAHAGTVYWDADGSTTSNALSGAAGVTGGTSIGGTSSWDTSTPQWWNGYATSDQAWANGNFDTAVFVGTTGTVTLNTGISAGGLSFNTTNFTLAGSSALTLGGASTPSLTAASAVTATISASLAGTSGFTANGAGTLVLSGNNSGLSGGITIASGIVTAASANALGANAITLGNTTGTGTASLLVSASGLSYANAITLATNPTTGALTVGNTGTAISTTFTGGVTGSNNLTINEGATSGTVTFSTAAINNAGTVTNAGTGTGTTSITGGIGSNVTSLIEGSNTSALTVSTTALTVNSAGTSLINNAASGTTAILTVSGGVTGTGNLILSNNNSSITNGIQLTTNAVNNTGSIVNQGTGTSAVLISAPIGSSVTGITQNSVGSALTLSSAASTFAGPIAVNSGTLSLSGALNGGSGGALTVGGGIFSYAPTIAASTQTVGGLTANAGGSVINASSGNTLALGALTARNAGGTVAFNTSTTGIISTSIAPTNNIVGPWATYGSGTTLAYATLNGGNLAAYTSYTGTGDSTIAAATGITATNGSANYLLNTAGSGSAGDNASIDTLRSTTGAVTVTPSSIGGLTVNGLMNAGTGTLTIGSGSLLIGAGAAPYANELVLVTNTQALAVSATITGTGTVTVDPTSTGAITLTNANNTGQIINAGSGTGTTTITTVGSNVTGLIETGASPLTITNAVTPTASLNTFVNNGTAAFTLTGGIAAGTQNIVFNANSRGTFSVGTIASTGTITNSGTGTGLTTITGAVPATINNITENSAGSGLTVAGVLTMGSGGTTFVNNNTSGSAILTVSGGVSGTGPLVLNNNSAISGGVTVGAISSSNSVTNSGTGTGTTNITGIIASGVTGVIENSATSTLVLSGANAYTSTTTITAGTVQIGADNNLGSTTATIAPVSLNGGTLKNTATATVTDTHVVTVGANGGTINVGVGQYYFHNASTLQGSGALTVSSGGTLVGNSGNLRIDVAQGFSGTMTLTGGGSLEFGVASAVAAGATFNIANQGELIVNNGVTLPNAITVSGGTNSVLSFENGATGVFSGAITLNANAIIGLRDWYNYAAATGGTISGLISGVGSLTLSPANVSGGAVTLSGANNTFSGGVIIPTGTTLTATATGSLGSGAITLSGGTLTVATNANPFAQEAQGSTLTVTTGSTFNANVANAMGTTNLAQTGGTVTENTANAFQGQISLNLSGGTTNLSVANNYLNGATISGTNVTNVSGAGALSGMTIVQSGGTLSSNLSASAASGGTIDVNSGGVLTSAAAGGAFQNVALSAGGVINAGGVGAVGNGVLTLNGLSTSGGTLQFDVLNLSSYDQINSTGALVVGSGTNIGFSSGLPVATGNYKLIQYTGTAPTLGNFVLPTAPAGLTYALSAGADAGFIDLVVSGTYTGITGNWAPTASPGPFSWNTATNWSGNVVPQLAGDTANFNSALEGPQAVTVDGQQHVGTVVLNPSTANAYTISAGVAGSTIYLDNGASNAALQNQAQNNTISAPINLLSDTNVTVAAGTNLTLSGPISGAGELFMAGNGSLTLSGTSAWTGGTEIDSGSIVINNVFGGANTSLAGVVTLNGGTLSVTGTSGTQTTVPSSFVLNVGPNGGTLNIGGATSGTSGKVNTNAVVGFLTGSGTLTKTGGSVLQDGSPSIGFTGNVILSNNGLIEDQNVAALGFGTGPGFGGGSVTINGPSGANAPELVVSVGTQLFNPVTLNGGTLSTDNGNTAIINSTVNVTAASTLRASDFFAPTSARVFAISNLTGSANLAVNGSTTANAIGMVTLGNASGYTGTITVGANAALGIGSGSFFGASATINNFTNASSGIGLVADGDGTSSPETIAFTLPTQVKAATFGTGNTTGYIVGKQGATTLFNQEANKTISFSSALPYNNTNTLNVQPFNGYGLLLTAQPALTATTTFGVGNVVNVGGVVSTAQPSNLNPGLTLTNLTGTNFGIAKTGVGTLQLGTSASDTGNTFGFATSTANAINVTGGIVSAFADANLGAAGNGITLNSTSGAEFLALNSFATSRTITLSSATGATLGAASGATLTINSGLAYGAAGNTLTKVEDGTVVLTTAATGAPTSATTISAGALAITASNQIGSGTITVSNNLGATLQISGGGTFTQALSLSNYGINGGGALESVSGTNTWNTGTITMSNAGAIGADAGSTLTIGSVIAATGSVGFIGGGNITVNTAMTGTGTVTQYGSGVLTFNATGTTYGTLSVDAGTMKFAGTATAGAGGTNINYGGTLTVDDTVTNPGSSRLAARSLATVGGGSFNLLGINNATSNDGFLGINVGRGQTVFTVTPSGTGQANLTLTQSSGSWTRQPYATAVFASGGGASLATTPTAGAATINTGSITTAANFQGAGTAQTGTANIGILPWALVNNNGTVSLATSTVIGANGYLRNLTASETTASFQNYLNANAASATNTLATTAASTTLVTNNNLAASLFVGESVSGTNIPAGAYITAIAGSTITLSAAGTAAGTNIPITFGTTGTNVSLAAGNNSGPDGIAGQPGILTQTINSLTLNTGANLNFANSNQVITIANTALGGAILALDATGNTISGGQISGGTGSTSELIVHTVGNLTINSAIVGGGGGTSAGLTKGDNGTLVIGGTAFYAGQTVVNAGTLTLNHGNNTIQYANYMELGAGATLNLNGNSQIVADLLSDQGAVTGLGTIGSNSTVTGTTGALLVIKGDGSSRAYTGAITGAVGVVHSNTSATSIWTLTQNNNYTGATLINGGIVNLINNGALSGTNSLTINRASLILDNSGSTDSSSRLSSSLSIFLGGGTIGYVGRAQFNSSETLGDIAAIEGANTIAITQQNLGVSGATLTLGGPNSLIRATGATVNFTNNINLLNAVTVSGNSTVTVGSTTGLVVGQTITGTGISGTITSIGATTITLSAAATASGTITANIANAPLGLIGGANVSFGANAPILYNNIIDGGTTVNGSDFASYNATYGVGALSATGFAGYSPLLINNAGATDNVNMTSGTGVPISSETINTLRIAGTTAINFTDASQTLTIDTGGLLSNSGLTLGSAANQGNLTANFGELFLLGGATSVINAAITGADLTLVKSGSGSYTINGTNTYTGGTYVDQGTLTLGNGGNATVGQSTLGTGDIFLNGGNLTQQPGAVIPLQKVTIGGNSTLTLNSNLVVGSSVTTLGSNVITVPSTNGIAVGQLVTGTGIPGNEFVTGVNPANNTITISSGLGVTAQTATSLTFLVNNSLSDLKFVNDGGSSNPTVAVTGVLNLPNGKITASSNNVATTSTLSGGIVDLGDVASPTITVSPITSNGKNIAPLQPTLNISSALQNASHALTVTGGGNLQLSGASTFSGGVNLAGNANPALATNLTIGVSSTNMSSGQPISGPLGTGTFTIGQNSTLLSTGNFTVGNNVIVTGDFSFDAPSSSAVTLSLGAGSQTIALPASAATTITVNAPNMTGAFNDTVTGLGSTIVKAGLGTLQLNNQPGGLSTFSGGVVINAGALLATGTGATGTALGSGPVIINGGVLQLHHSGQSGNSAINYGNNVDINTSLANAYIDVNNNGSNTGNTIVMGTLDYGTVSGTSFTSTTVSGNAAPSTILNVTGGNSYKLQFTGTTLTSSTSSATFNVASGLTLILPGGFAVGTNLPINVGPGTLMYSGNNSGATAPGSITGTVAVAPATGGSSTPLGTGGITLGTGGTLQISPVYGTLTTTGYTSNGATAKYYFTGGTTIYAAGNYGIAPGSTLAGVNINDRIFTNAPQGVNSSGLTTSLATYQALLTVTTGGTYNFGMGVDDFGEIVVDGQVVQNTGITGQSGLASVNLSAGAHQITVRYFNNGSGGGGYVLYSGPDTASNNIIGQQPVNNLQALPLSALSYATNYVAGNNYQNAAILNNAITVASSATATVDGLGTDFNYAVPSLILNSGSTLTIANGSGASAGSAGGGAFIVTGLTSISATGVTVSPTTGTLVLAGGVSDGGFGLTKTGAGTLIMGGSAGTFTGPLNISNGFVQLQDPAGLTTGTTNIGVAGTTAATLDLNGQTVTTNGNIVLNGGAGPTSKSSNAGAGLYNSNSTAASLPAGGTLSIGAVIGSDASIGGFGDISILGKIQDSVAGSPLDKVGPDTLTLSNTNTFTGAFNIKGGTVKITGANGFTSSATAAVVESAGTTVDLNGQTVTVAKPLTINGSGQTGLGIPNQLGALVNSGATAATYPGAITLAATSTIGGPSLIAGVNGGITLSGTISGANQITKIGANSLTLTGAGAETIFDLQDGSLTFSGGGAQSSTSNADFAREGTTLTLDNTSQAVSQRLGNHGLFLTGNLVINGNSSTAVAETISQGGNNINIGQANGIGQATITIAAAGTAGVNLSVASTSTSIFNRGAGSTLLLRGDNLGNTQGAGVAAVFGGVTSLGQSANNAQSVGQTGTWNAPNALIYQWAVADQSASGVGTSFAGYSSFGGANNFGTANTGGVAPISINANNAFSAVPTLNSINANTVQNNSTITVASTTGLAVGQLVTGSNIPANAVITSIINGTTFTISALVGNVSGATANTTLNIYANPSSTVSSNITNANATVTVGSTSNLYVGEVVSGTGIANGTTIASILSATQYTLSANATATNASASLNYALAGYANVMSTASTLSVGTASVAQEQNSITLNNATGSTLTLAGSLQLDSGGVLVVGTNAGSASYTIAGPGTLTGTNSLNREMVFHVTGTGTTLTVNAPIYTNGGGLTKADGGTLILGTAENYTGNTILNGGLTKLNGGNNTLFTVYSVPSSVGNSGASVSGQTLEVNNGATLDLNGTNEAVSNLATGSSVQLSGGTIVNSSATAATLHIAPNGNQTWAGNISNAGTGAINLVRDGNNTTTFNSPNTFSGTVTVTGGATTLVDLGTFQNASAINVTRAALIWNDQGVQAVSNRLSSTAPILLSGGGLQFLTRAGTGANPVDAISLGTLNLGIGESNVVVSSVGQGGSASVTFAALGTHVLGSTLNFGNTGLAAGDNPRYFFTTAPTLTNGMIGAWATVTTTNAVSGVSGISFATYDPASGIRPLQYEANLGYGAGVNLGITATTTIPAPLNVATTTTVNSLAILNGAFTLNFTNANDTLVIQSGGIISGTDNNARNIGSTGTPGILQSGAGNDLYIHNGANTFTINSRIIDNGSNNNVIIDGASTGGNTIQFTNANTYGGTTYLSGATLTLNSLLGPAIPHDVILSGGNNASTDSLAFNGTNLNLSLSNQLTPTANVTMIGATQFNVGGGTNGSAVNTQTINNLTFNNDGGSNGGNGPSIYSGAGTLTINGTITSTNNTETFTIPVINGFVNLGTGNIQVDANQFVNNQVGLALNANITAPSITLTGTGWLGIGGQSTNFTGPVNVNTTGGGLAISASGAFLGGQVILGSGSILDTRGLSATIGSLASSFANSVVENGLQSAAGTLTTGFDNTDSTFAGTFQSPFANSLLNLTKIGTGTLTLTNNSTATNNGTFTINNGQATVNGANGVLGFSTYNVATYGTLLLDDSTNAVNNRLGGIFLTPTAATLAPTLRALNLQGGNLVINGKSGTAVSEALGSVGGLNGSTITLNAAGTGGINLTLQALGTQGAGTSLLIEGDGLGATIGTNNAGANVATVSFPTVGAVNTTGGLPSLTGGGGANNTFTKSIRPDILVSSSASGTNAEFLTVDSVTGLIRPLSTTTELQTTPTLPVGYTLSTTTTTGSSTVTVGSTSGLVVGEGVSGTGVSGTIASIIDSTHFTLTANASATGNAIITYGLAATNQNVKTSAITPLFVNTTVNSINLNSGGGFTSAVLAGNPWGSNGGLLTLTNSSTAVLNTAGSNTISVGSYAYGGITADFHVLTGSTLTLNANVNGSTGGFTKSEGGTLILNGAFYGNNGMTISVNGGTLQFGANLPANPLWVYTNGSGAPSAENLAVNNGTVDLNGNNLMVGTVTSTNPLPYGGGTSTNPGNVITNTSATAATFVTNAAASVFSGEFTGNLNLDKTGSTTMTLSSPQSYTGTTTVRGGTLSLRDSASIASTGAINLTYGALQLDNTGLSDSTNRIQSTAPINMNGGSLKFLLGQRVESESIGTVALGSGANEINLNTYNNTGNSSSFTLTIANLTQTSNATFNIVGAVSTALGNFSGANSHVYLTQLNGAPFSAASMVDNIIAPWFTVNQNDWATYSNVAGVTTPNANGTANYTNTTLTTAGVLDNVSLSTTTTGGTFSTVGVTGRTINTLALRAPAETTVVGMNGPLDQLVIASGGVILNTAQAISVQGGSITAGTLNNPSTLYLNSFSTGTTTFNTPIVNNGTGALSLVRSGGGIVTLNPLAVETVASVGASSTTITVPNSTGLVIGMGVSGTNITSGSVITNIVGNVVTLSTATGTTAATNAQVTFNPVQSTATGGTTSGSNTVTILAANLPTGFTPTVGMTIGSSVNIPGGATITAVTLGATDTITLSTNATATSSTATLVFNPLNNTYSGTTTVSSGVLDNTGGALNLSGPAGSVSIQGDLIINNSTVTENTNQGQIAATSNVTINGGGNLTLVGTNTLNTVTMTNNGGTSTPIVNVGTLLNLSSATPITVANDNTGTVSTITGGTLNFTNAGGVTINTSGLSLNDMVIASQITSAGTITKTGNGSLILPNANTASLTWTLSGGSLFVGNVTALGTNSAAGALSFNGNVGLSATAGGLSILLPTIFTAPTNLTLGGQHGNNNISLAGPMNLNGQNPTITVPAAVSSDIIVGPITGTGGFTKAGNGILSLSPGFSQNNSTNNSTTSGSTTVTVGTTNGLYVGETVSGTGIPVGDTVTAILSGTQFTVATAATASGTNTITATNTLANTFTGPISVTGGLLVMGNANTFGGAGNAGADYTVASKAELNMAGLALSMGSLSGGGIVTDSGGAQALTIGAGGDVTNATFSGALTAATQANLSLIKTGTNNETLSGTSFYTGVTTVNGGILTLQNGSTSATTATLNNTSITVGSTAALDISVTGANAGTNNTVNIGDLAGSNAGASVTLSAGGTLDLRDGALGTFKILGNGTGTSFTAAATSNLFFDVGNGGADLMVLSRAASITSGATINLNVAAGATGIPLGVIPLITAGSGFTGSGTNNFTLANTTITIGAKTYTLTLAGTQDTTTQTALLVTVAAPTNAYWSGAVDANWNTGSISGVTNWRTDAASNIDTQAIPTSATNVFFNTTTPAATHLSTNLAQPFSVASLTFTGAATSPVTIGDSGSNTNTLTIGAGGLNVNAGAGADTINANVVLGADETWTNNSSNTLTVNGSATLPGVTGSGRNLTVGGSGNTTIAASIQTGVGNVTYNGTGTLNLSGNNTCTGDTNVNQGKVVVSGSLAGNVNVASGATLASGANISSQVAAINAASDALGGGTVAPGDSGGANLSTIGQLNATGAVTLGVASTAGVAHLSIEIGGTNDGTTGGNTTGPLQYDRVAMSGSTLTLNNANLDVSLVNGFAYTEPSYDNTTQQFNLDGHIFFLITGASNVVGTFANQFAVGTDPNAPLFATIYGTNGQEFAISYTANFAADTFTGGNDVAIMAIPEPNSMAMLAGSLGLALGLQRFRRRRTS